MKPINISNLISRMSAAPAAPKLQRLGGSKPMRMGRPTARSTGRK